MSNSRMNGLTSGSEQMQQQSLQQQTAVDIAVDLVRRLLQPGKKSADFGRTVLPGCHVNLGDQVDVGHIGHTAMLHQQNVTPPTGPRCQRRLKVACFATQRFGIGKTIDRCLPRQAAPSTRAASGLPNFAVGQALDCQPMRPWLRRASRSACCWLASQRSTSASLICAIGRDELNRQAAQKQS